MTAHTTPELAAFVTSLLALSPGSQNGGTYANKPGYHNTRAGNAAGNYSVVDAVDKLGPADMCAAADWTFPNAQHADYQTIILYTSRLLASAKDANDPRLNVMREFYGQADQDTQVEGWDTRYGRAATSDPSHLWHIHFSFSRATVGDPHTFAAVLSVLRGEPWHPQPSEETPMVELLIVKDGPVPGGIYASSGAGLVLVTAAEANTRIDRGMCLPGLKPGQRGYTLGAFTLADATAMFGPILNAGTGSLPAHKHVPGDVA